MVLVVVVVVVLVLFLDPLGRPRPRFPPLLVVFRVLLVVPLMIWMAFDAEADSGPLPALLELLESLAPNFAPPGLLEAFEAWKMAVGMAGSRVGGGVVNFDRFFFDLGPPPTGECC